jgi:PiT family inorganic phosphate transporter
LELTALIFLSSGLFLGWSLGANDAANVFGTAVGSRMIRFGTAAGVCSVFLVLGAVWGGTGAADGLGALGGVSTLPGAFTVALSAAVTVYAMTRAGLPVSTSQAIVGAIVGWNWFIAAPTDHAALAGIAATWVFCPILAGCFAAVLYFLVRGGLRHARIHLIRRDLYVRLGLLLAGAFGAYSLGANNIANVMGVFRGVSPFTDITLPGGIVFDATHQLFLIGALAVALGVVTYSKRVMMTVGDRLMPLNPVAAWVAVVAHALVLFLFSSAALQDALISRGLPAPPLIPVSSSQAIIGAVLGIGLLNGLRGLRQIRWGMLVRIAAGWVLTPAAAALLCLVSLYLMQNLFNQPVRLPAP